MNRDWVRNYCLSLPHATEQVQWKIDLVFKIGGKMFTTLALEPGRFAWPSNARPKISRS